MGQRFVGLVGRIGPAFTEGKGKSGRITIAEPANDSTWLMDIPGRYFADNPGEQLRAAFDHLIKCDGN